MELGLSVEMEISERAFAVRYYVGPGGLWWSSVLNLTLPPQRLRPDTWPEHQNPVSHMAPNCGTPHSRGPPFNMMPLPFCPSKSFTVSDLTFRSLIHFEFIFVYGVRECSSVILFFFFFFNTLFILFIYLFMTVLGLLVFV